MTVPERLPIAESKRWQLLRAGIQNVWEYDDQRFVFHRGRLMLRGQNESGKTKALEVLLPFVLDASLQPHRLDPFGSSARSMRWNLINDSNPSVNVNIGYVWLELGRLGESGPEYLTVGAGLKARRTSPQVDDWYFATSQRVGATLDLAPNRTPLTRPNLEAALGAAGTVFDSAAQYRRALNERLFGLSDDQYSALVDALLQLRRPQLSKGLDPVELSNILTASLPPLDSQVVGSIAEGFERLDRHRTEREECSATLDAVRGFLGVYRQYAAAVAKGRALEVTRADSAFHAARAKQKEAEARRDAAKSKLEELSAQLHSLENEGITLEERIRVLQESDAFRAVSELEAAQRRARATQEAASRADAAAAQGKAQAARKETGVAEARRVAEQDGRDLETERRAGSRYAEACGLAEPHAAMVRAQEQGQDDVARDTLATTLRMRAENLDALKKLTRLVDEAERGVETATVRASAAEQRAREAQEAVDRAAAAESAARARLLEDVEAWVTGCREVRVDAGALAELPPEQMRAFAEAAAAAVRLELDGLSRAATLALDTAARELEATRAARAALEGQQHQPPAPPAWRTPRTPDRPGAPLYLLCDFAPHVEPAARAGLEAALEASGLLDAWVTPEGEVLDADAFDSLLKAHPVSGPTLAEVLRPAEGAAVAPEHVSAVLRSIALGEAPAATAWVAEDGRFALGPLEGKSGKSEAGFIGAAARERARRERLAELAREVSRLEEVAVERARAVEALQRRRATLDGELRAFPDVQPLRDRQADVRARTDELAAAGRQHQEESERLRRAEAARVAAAQKLSERAGEAGLRGWLGRLEELAERTAAWRASAGTLLVAFERARRSRSDLEARRGELAEVMQQVQQLGSAADDARRQALEAAARASELAATIGKDHEELLVSLRAAEQRKNEVRGEQARCRTEQAGAQSDWGALEAGVGAAALKVEETDASRREAELRFRIAEGRGLLAMLGVVGPRPAPEWTWTDVLTTARKVDEATGKADASDAGRDKAWNRVSERHQELMRALKPELKVLASQGDGVTVYEATWNARKLTLLELDSELEGDLAARDRLLADEERRLFESFLTGEAHEHLRERLREASALVKRMNRQLDAHPTSSGMVMRLRWDVAENAAPGTKEAVALLFKSGELMSDSDREALMGFLRQRLDEARNGGDAARPLQEQLLAVLDYRRWHLFEVECRVGTDAWKRLTRKVHAAGSGGQKAVMLHLPLFAAAAAFYDSAREGAPRFILLDEAFAGIDRQTRGELMGLLADFDLDFVMTSFEEWGFYPQLDGLSTYHLAREKGMPGVYSEWFVWNGREPVQMQA